MRKHPVPYRLLGSVAVLLFFSQSPFAAEERLTRTSVLEKLPPGATILRPALPDGIAGESFYDDYLVLGEKNPGLLLVLDDDLPEEFMLAALESSQEPWEIAPAVLFAAPRHNPADTGTIAGAIAELPPDTPRIFLASGEHTEWTVSVPGRVTPVWLVRTMTTFSDVPISIAQLNAAHLGFGRRDTALRAALDAGSAAARLTLRNPDDLGRIISQILVGLETVPANQRNSERNYLVVPLATPIIVGEFLIVQGLIALVIVLLVYSIILPRRVLHYLRSIAHNLPAILISLLVIMASLIVANLTIRVLRTLTPFSPSPLLLVGGKFALASTVISFLATALGHRIRYATAVYSGAAVLFLLLAAILSGAVSIVMGAYFTVSFFFGVLFSFGRTVWIKAFALLCALAPLVYLVLALAPAADEYMTTALLTPPLVQEVFTAIMLLPLLLMFLRLDSIASRTPLLPIFAMVATVGLALVAATLITEVRNPGPYALFLREEFSTDETVRSAGDLIQGERMVTAGGAQIADSVTARISGDQILLCDPIPCTQQVSASTIPFSLDLRESRLLDRFTIEWRVEFFEPAESVLVYIESDDVVQLYAADSPMQEPIGSRGTRFVVDTGPLPPREIGGTLVLRSEGAENRVRARVTSSFPVQAFTIDEGYRVIHQGRIWTISDTVVLE